MSPSFTGMRISITENAEDFLKRYMKRHNLDNFSEAIEHMCVTLEQEDK